MFYILDLRDEALKEANKYFDENIRALSKDEFGKIDDSAAGFSDNDVDAFRHAYVSGVYTLVFDANTANFFGIMNEILSLNGSNPTTSDAAENMDYWNNSIGRKYGRKTQSRDQLAKLLQEALQKGEMITDLKDSRKFKLKMSFKVDPEKGVVVLHENDTKRNELFVDMTLGIIMNREEFVSEIQLGKYPEYTIALIGNLETPLLKADSKIDNNLG